jgi:O-antigen ligase
VVLVAMGAGAFVQVLGSLVLSWSGSGWMRNAGVSGFSGFGQLQWQLHCAVAICAAAFRWLPSRGRAASIPALVASLFVVERAGRRLGLLAALVALAVVLFRPWPRLRASAWLIILAVALATTGAAFWSGAGARITTAWNNAGRQLAKDDAYAAACVLTGRRLPLAHAAWDAGLERPLIGHGRASYRLYLKDWAARQQAATTLSSRKSVLQPLTTGVLNDAHNAYLNAFAEGGIPAALFLGTALVGIGVRLWRQSRTAALAGVALALYSAVLLGSLCQPVTTKAPGAITAVCLAISGITRGDGPHSDRRRIR